MVKVSAAALLFVVGASNGALAFAPQSTRSPFASSRRMGYSDATTKVMSTVLKETTEVAGTDSDLSIASPPPTDSVEQAQEEQEQEQERQEERQLRREKVLREPALWEYNFGLQDPGLDLPHGLVAGRSLPETFEVTEEQIATLERDGVLHLKGVFDAEWVDYLRRATGHQVDNPHFWAFAGTASKLYDYIQRNVWQTNKAFANFYYHSAMGHILAQCGRTDEIRVSTDLLMVNPNKGFKWHQDNQNGPITWEEGIRFWITMDETPKDYGAPVYLQGSHRNTAVDEQAVFVDIEAEGLGEYKDKLLEFRTMPGDMLIWHPRTIHKIDGPADGIWTTYRRVLGGTVAKGGAKYHDKRGSGGILSDLGRHALQDGDKLQSSFFPIIYPQFDPEEAKERNEGKVGRSPKDIVMKIGGLAGKASGDKFFSFFQVLGSKVQQQ